MKYKLTRVSSYNYKGKRISRGEIIEVSKEDEEIIQNTGYFLPIDEREPVSIDGLSFCIKKERPPRHIKDNWSYKKIIVYLPGGLGDTVVGLSCISHLRRKPCEIVVLVNEKYIELGQLYSLDCKSALKVNNQDYTHSFDYFISLEGVYLANSRQLIAKDYYDAVFDEIGINVFKEEPLIKPNLSLLNKKFSLDNQGKKVFVHAGASNSLRQWARERWDTLVKQLSNNGVSVYLGGAENLLSYKDDNVISLSSVPLLEQIYILSKCDYFIGVDSGFMHIAGQLGKQGIVLLGPTLPEHVCKRYKFKTIGKKECRGCRNLHNDCKRKDKLCMNNITVNEVYNEIPLEIRRGTKRGKAVIPTVKSVNKSIVSLLKRPKTGWYLHKIGIGGGEIQVLRQAREMKKWFDIEFIWNNKVVEDEKMLKPLVEKEFVLHQVSSIKALMRQIESYDIIITHSPYPEIYEAIDKMKVKPVVVRQIRSGARNDLEMYYKYRHLIDVVCGVDKKVAEEVGGVWLPSSVMKFSRGNYRTKNLFKEKLPTLGYAGRVDGNKGIDFIVSCVDKFDFNLVLFVDKIFHEHFLSLVKNKGRIKVFDLDLNMNNFYSKIDCVVMNSEYEGSPTLILDGACSGKPAITTDVGTLRDIFGDLLFYFKKNDEDSFGKALLKLKNKEYDKRALKKAVSNLTVEKTALTLRKKIRKALGDCFGGINRILVTRWTGAGDFIMMSAFCNKIREMFPEAELWIQCNESAYNIAKFYADIIVNNKQKPDADIKIRQTYVGCWEKNQHAVEALGGNIDEIYLPLPLKCLHLNIKHPAVGFWIFQKHLQGRDNIKEWKLDNWKELARRLQEKGVYVYQLGASFEPKLDFLIDLRQDDIEDSFYTIKSMDLVVSVESVAGHVCNALKKKAIVLFPNASDVNVVGYDTNINIRAKSKCKCYGAFDVKTIPDDCKRNCMDTISIDEVWQAVRKELKI